MWGNTMLLDKEKLLAAIRIVDLVQMRSGIPTSEFIKMEAQSKTLLFSLTSEVAGRAAVKLDEDCPMKGTWFIDRRVLVPFLMQDNNSKAVEVGFVKESLVFKYGRRKLSLVGIDAISGYGDIKDDKSKPEVLKLSDDSKAMAVVAGKYAPADQSLAQLQCVYFGKDGSIVSSNSTNIFYGKATKLSKEILFPCFLVSALSNSSLTNATVFRSLVVLYFGNGFITQTLPAQTVKGFPIDKIKSLVVKGNKYPAVLTFSSQKLHDILSRLSTIVAANKDKTVRLDGADGLVKLSSGVSHAKVTDSFKAKCSTFSCELPLDEVLHFIEFAAKKDEEIRIRFEKNTPYILQTDSMTLVVSRKAK